MLQFWICGTLNEIRLWNQIKLVNLYTFEIDENLNEIRQLKLWHCWMCGTVEWDENVKLDNKTEFVWLLNIWNCWIKYNVNKIRILNLLNFWICGIVEWDYTVESDKTVEFVTLLNMLGLLNEIWTWK